VRAIKEGAENFLTKPVAMPVLLTLLQRLLENSRRRDRDLVSRMSQGAGSEDPFRGTSRAIRRLADEAARVAARESPVLILGETGSGKGVLARWLHAAGPRAQEPLVDLNCAGLTRDFLETELFGHEKGAFTGAAVQKRGLLEVAHRGTVFLDEIGELHPEVQPKILKALEEKRFRRLGSVRDQAVDIRLIAATHRNPAAMVADGTFRSDLYFRINTLPLHVPPLRERVEDIPILAQHLVTRLGRDLGESCRLTDGALRELSLYDWPGNVRELENCLERTYAFTSGPLIHSTDLPREVANLPIPDASSGMGDGAVPRKIIPMAELEKKTILSAIMELNGDKLQAARLLGIGKTTLYRKLKDYATQGYQS